MAKKKFKAVGASVVLKESPGGADTSIKIPPGIQFEVDGNSTDTGGFIWWKHAQGWVAEKSSDGSQVFLEDLTPAEAPTTDAGTQTTDQPMTDQPTTEEPAVELNEVAAAIAAKLGGSLSGLAGKSKLQAGSPDVNVRADASTAGKVIRKLAQGETVNPDWNTLAEADGYIWVSHEHGWSALQDSAAKTVFFVEDGTFIIVTAETPMADLPGFKTLLQRHPVSLDDTLWVQYFGNTTFAFTDGKRYNYDGYAQGLHGGLDYGNSVNSGIKVYAGVEGEYIKTLTPNVNNVQVWVRSGEYVLIYQHLIFPQSFSKGDKITPDTLIGQIHAGSQGGWNHLHFEIRFRENYIVNPLALMSDEMREAWEAKFDPKRAGSGKSGSTLFYFYVTAAFNKWGAPLEQPIILRGKRAVGPGYV